MVTFKSLLSAVFLGMCALLVCCSTAAAQHSEIKSLEIFALDPQPQAGMKLSTNERLFIGIRYESEIPLRFQARAYREGIESVVGALANPASLHISGKGDALAWIEFTNPTHIDEIKVTIFDVEWREIDGLSRGVDIAWGGTAAPEPRAPAEWVNTLLRAEQRKKDYYYDPVARKNETLYDMIFFLTVASLPVYVLIQVQMLRRYRGRWRELACMPFMPFFPLVLYSMIALELELTIWAGFLLRYIPFALMYLIVLWVIKHFKTRSPLKD